MVNTINVKIGGEGVQAVYPFSFKNVLDESLDEATITCYSETETYLCGTEVTVEVTSETTNETTIKTYYYVVSSDNAIETPVGSGQYRHDVGLIEETKMLEGIICPSLTFTNTKAKSIPQYPAEVSASAIIIHTAKNLIYDYTAKAELTSSEFPSIPFSKGKTELPSIESVGNELLQQQYPNYWEKITILSTEEFNDKEYSSCINIKNSDGETICHRENDISLTLVHDFATQGEYTVEYTIYTVYTYEVSVPEETVVHENFSTWVLTIPITVKDTEILPTKKWSITDCVLRVLECAEPLYYGENPKYTFDGVTYKNGVAGDYETGSQAAEYDKILAPEFTMTQCTLREQLKVIGSFIHAEPRLEKKGNQRVIRFDKYWLGTESSLGNKYYVYKSPSINFSQYATSIISNASNVVSNSDNDVAVIDQPARCVTSLNVNERITAENAVATTDYPIQSIVNIEAGILNDSGSGYKKDFEDITKWCFEETEYNTLSSYDTNKSKSKAFAFYYTIGQPNVKGLFFVADKAISKYKKYAIRNVLITAGKTVDKDDEIQKHLQDHAWSLVLRITYVPYYNAIVSHGKPRVDDAPQFTQYYNQSENQIDTQYFGENIKGVAARLGNAEQERTYILNSLEEIPHTGEMIEDFTISAVAVDIMPLSIKCTVSLTKDFNRISEYIGINSVKRLWEVSEREVYDRNILIKENLIVTTHNPGSETYKVDFENLPPCIHSLNSVKHFFEDKGFPITLAYIITKNYNRDNIAIRSFPVNTSSFGNSTMVSLYAKDNYSAGIKLVKVPENDEGVKGYWSEDVPYADYHGRVYWLDFDFYNAEVSSPRNYPNAIPIIRTDYDEGTYAYRYISTAESGSAKPLRLRKDSRERITITCSLEAKSGVENLFVGSALAECNAMVSNLLLHHLVLYVFNDEVALDKFATTADFPDSAYEQFVLYDKLTASLDSTGYFVTVSITDIPANKEGYTYNRGFGYVLATKGSTKEETVINEKGEKITQTYNDGGKILLTCTHKRGKCGTLNLYFYITR